jgi:hypothetical protein
MVRVREFQQDCVGAEAAGDRSRGSSDAHAGSDAVSRALADSGTGGHAVTRPDAIGVGRGAIRRSSAGWRTRQSAAATASAARRDAEAGRSHRLDDRAVTRSARRTQARPLGRRAGRVTLWTAGSRLLQQLLAEREGYDVTVIDRQPGAAQETSFANGCQISVSHADCVRGRGAIHRP